MDEEDSIAPSNYDYVNTSDSDSESVGYGEEGEEQISVDHGFNVVASDTSGYEYEFVKPVLPSQKCPVCKLPMRDAVQTIDCGHRFCRGCLEQALRTAENCVCPTCRTSVDEKEGYYADLAWSRDILALIVKCVQNEEGCDWTGELRHIEGHKEGCLYEKLECIDCGEFHQRRNMVYHQFLDCQQRIKRCTFCNKTFPFIELQRHKDEDCKRYPLQCANGCKHEPIPREEMQYHIENDCPMTKVKCSYENVGCQYEGKRCSISKHLGGFIEEHLQLTTSELSRTRSEVDEMKKNYHYLEECFKQLEEKNHSMNKNYRYLEKCFEQLKEKNDSLEKQICKVKEERGNERALQYKSLNQLPQQSFTIPTMDDVTSKRQKPRPRQLRYHGIQGYQKPQ